MLPKETSEFIEQKLINVTDKVTVIVPVYNVSSFLSKCIESICEQEYPFLEIILVDDGSTDESGKICDSYAEKDARIKVIHKQNQGVSSARNTGLDVATGRWICFVDGGRLHNARICKLYAGIRGCLRCRYCIDNTYVWKL